VTELRTALVTGASRGIGRALAEGLSGAGFRVGLVARETARLDAVAEAITAGGGVVATAAADATDPAAVAAAVTTVESALGPVSLLINNAGTIDPGEVPAWQADPADWWRVLETNLRGPYLFSQAVLPALRDRGGRIVNITGMVLKAVPGYSAYCVSKAALSRLTESLAESGVLVFDVSPGTVLTDLTAGMPIFAGRSSAEFATTDNILRFVLTIASGQFDRLSGRYFHAQHDDIDALLAHADDIVTADARQLRMARYGPADPLP
jgi:3-oxoacyl-[acyl-carrier protein] reductase